MLKRTKFLRRTAIKRTSKRRMREGKIYRDKRLAFLAVRPFCQAWSRIQFHLAAALRGIRIPSGGIPLATDVHHVRGRGRFYLDESTWMAVSRESHQWIHNHPKEAREIGLLQ